jgi:DNA-binding NtrC family response regulator
MNKILVVDDDKAINKIYSNALSKKGYEVFSVFNTEDARLVLTEHDISVVILDRQMPGENGDEFAEKFNFGATVPLMLTGSNFDDDYVVDRMRRGLIFVLQKGCSLNKIFACVEYACKLYEIKKTNISLIDKIEEIIRGLSEAEECLRQTIQKY